MIFDFVSEIKNLLKLYKAFVDEIGSITEEIEERTISMIEDHKRDGKVKKEDVLFVEKKGYDMNLINADILKAVTRIQFVHTVILAEGIDLALTQRDENILKSISNGKDSNFLFVEKNGIIDYADDEMKAYFHGNVEAGITDESAQHIFEEYRSNYERYKEFKKTANGGGKESDGK